MAPQKREEARSRLSYHRVKRDRPEAAHLRSKLKKSRGFPVASQKEEARSRLFHRTE